MLLSLIPPQPLPTILFTISFPTLPHSLPLPPAWDAHLRLLAHASLPAPPSLYALDKSLLWTALLDTVSFDLGSLTVTCIFIDGTNEEWPLTNRAIALLDSVVKDVHNSAFYADLESAPPAPPPAPPPSPPSPQQEPVQKQKKRRSIFASLIASLSLSLVPPPVPTRTPLPPPPPPPPRAPTPPPPPPQPTTTPPSRLFRRRARSTLVDTFRRFVLTELSSRAPPSFSYALWAAGTVPPPSSSPSPPLSPDDASSSSDGSSVHTPLDAHDVSAHGYAEHAHPHSIVAHYIAQDRASRVDAQVLEVRSRRRAWSCGCTRVGDIGLGVPRRRSPLCQTWMPGDGMCVRGLRMGWEDDGDDGEEAEVEVEVEVKEMRRVDVARKFTDVHRPLVWYPRPHPIIVDPHAEDDVLPIPLVPLPLIAI